jgi:2-polyprenyl-6-methoxyphenol hydroxylase-like FAD-dependent oxidoreductase
MSTRKPIRVLIVGAGTGGLCLAHGLQRAGIDVAVYERDRTRTDGLHGYRVGIDPDGSRALHACLPPELFATFMATCARAPRFFNILTEQLDEVLSLPLLDQRDPVESEKSVSRMTLRQVLLTGLEEIVHFDKTFTRYEQHTDGTVTAFFADGESATGDLIVGADGTSSPVRKQCLPHARLEDIGIVAIAGKLPLTAESGRLVPRKAFYGISMVMAPRGFNCILHVMEFPWTGNKAPKAGVGSSDAELIASWPGLLFDNTTDYINWGFAAAAPRFPRGVMQHRGGDLMELVLRMTSDWSPNFRQLVRQTDPTTCFPVNIRTSVPLAPWRSSNVTLIGDAIHTMTPGRGVGANTALRDAELLCRNLIAVERGHLTLRDAVAGYESRMREYAWPAVLKSREQMDGDGIMHKPLIGRLALAGMRTGMRIVNHLPPLKQRMADGLQRERGAHRPRERSASAVPAA